MKVEVDIVGVTKNDGNFALKGIPIDDWHTFVKYASEVTNNQKDGWAELLFSFIRSVNRGTSRVILINDIPESVYDSFQNECEKNKSTIQEVVVTLLKASDSNIFRLYTLHETEPDEESSVLMLNGMKKTTLQRFQAIVSQATSTPLELFQNIEESINLGKFYLINLDNLPSDSSTLIVRGLPDASMKRFEEEATKFRRAYKDVSGEESQINGLDILAHLLNDAGKDAVFTMNFNEKVT